jgi:hypothetical protein
MALLANAHWDFPDRLAFVAAESLADLHHHEDVSIVEALQR